MVLTRALVMPAETISMPGSAKSAFVRRAFKVCLCSPDPIQQVPVLRDYIDRTDIVDAREPVASVLLIPPELPWSAGFTTFEGRVETE
jgi:hypothetical protein